MIKFIKDLLTEDDGDSWCWARVASSLGVLAYLGDATIIIYKTGNLDLVQFATGFGILLAGAGAAIAAKAATQKTTAKKE